MIRTMKRFLFLLISSALLACCRSPAAMDTPETQAPLPATAQAADMTEAQAATLSSLALVDPHPLYSMHYSGGYGELPPAAGLWEAPRKSAESCPAWACSLFAALGRPGASLSGRNFDWEYSPALLLFTDPPDGYASVSMVDIAYLGFRDETAAEITALPLEERAALLEAPWLPFDGMNEKGLSIGMAAVPAADGPSDPAKQTIDSLAILRLALDRAATVEQAAAIFGQYNLAMGGGPPLHYLAADSGGHSAVIELYKGEVKIFWNEYPWQAATNFLLANPEPCQRYERIQATLMESGGELDPASALDLLREVSQAGYYPTQWSVVYELDARRVNVVMGGKYETIHEFELKP